MTIQAYNEEIKAGIGDLVTNDRITFASAIYKPATDKSNNECLTALAKFNLSVASANPNQVDLFYRHSILASVGWNLNDDVFDKMDTWNAKHTVTDKQLNLHHNELNIVGHMTNSFVFDEHGKVLDSSLSAEQIPDRFDVVSEFVLYRMWENEERRDEVNRIIAEIEQGKWFVSMECRFPAFDYAIIDLDGTHRTVARSESTAFLSRHLRAFGGTGEYEGRRVGRLLRGFFFTGQGIVENPANERSIIFDAKALKPFKSQGSLTIRATEMDEKQLAELKAQLDAATATITSLKADNDALKSEKVKASEEEVAKVKAAKEEADKKVTALEGTVAEKDKAITTLTTELASAKERAEVSEKEIASLKAEAVKQVRANKLAAAGVDADKIEAELAKWDSLTDVQFDAIVAMFPPKKDDKKDDKKEDKSEAETTTKTEADFAKATAEQNAALNQKTEETTDRVKALANHLSAGLPFSARASKRLEKNN